MKRKLATPFFVVSLSAVTACGKNNILMSFEPSDEMVARETAAENQAEMELKKNQSRAYVGKDQKTVLKVMVDVLQDDGFVVKNAVPELGLLSAQKELSVQNDADAVIGTFLFGTRARWSKNSIIEATVNVSGAKNETRVRTSFQVKTSDNVGNFVGATTVSEEAFYKKFYERVDKDFAVQD